MPESLKVAAYLVTNLSSGEPSICFEDERGDYGDEDHTPVFEELIKKSDLEAALQSALKDRDAEIERLKKDAERSADWCSEVRQDREMVASALQALLKDPLNPETTEMAHLALGEHING
ncbi:hypothetical protein C4F17_12465 [Variovorax sp. PMC12]|nr:hypothetical protein C4F17_12465 [Variovorax sp. PMC12]